MKLVKYFQIVLGILLCASGAGVAVRVITGLLTKEYAAFPTVAVILLVMCLIITAIGVRFLILACKPKPHSTKRRETLRLIIGILALTMFLAYTFLCCSTVQKRTYEPKPAVSSYENRIIAESINKE